MNLLNVFGHVGCWLRFPSMLWIMCELHGGIRLFVSVENSLIKTVPFAIDDSIFVR